VFSYYFHTSLSAWSNIYVFVHIFTVLLSKYKKHSVGKINTLKDLIVLTEMILEFYAILEGTLVRFGVRNPLGLVFTYIYFWNSLLAIRNATLCINLHNLELLMNLNKYTIIVRSLMFINMDFRLLIHFYSHLMLMLFLIFSLCHSTITSQILIHSNILSVVTSLENCYVLVYPL
jgi:hypothetical protein